MKRIVLSVAACIALTALPARSAELADLKAKYDAAKVQLEAAAEKQKAEKLTAYGTLLASIMTQLKQKGDLDGYLAAEKEKKRFDAEKTTPEKPEGEYAAKAVEVYKASIAKVDADQAARMMALQRAYIAQLEPLIKTLMQADKIDAAKKVKEELDRVKFELAEMEVATTKAEPPKPTEPAEKGEEEKPEVRTAAVTSLLLSAKDAAEKGYKLLGSWPTDNTGGLATDGQRTRGTLYLFVQKGVSGQPITDVILYNAQAGNSPATGTPKGYDSLGYWDVQSSVDSFGTANQWNISLCVKKERGRKPVLDVLLNADAGAQKKGYASKGSFNGLTLWVKYAKGGGGAAPERIEPDADEDESAAAPEKSLHTPGRKLVPKDAQKFNGHHYLVIQEKATWPEARDACERKGGHLAVIKNARVNDFLGKMVGGRRVWIGLTDEKAKGKFTWVDGSEPAFTSWYQGEPDLVGDGGKKRYVDFVLWEGAPAWAARVENIGWNAGYVCEWDY
jgi:hypothetical protein